jgi:hypothetical protein
MATTRLRHAFKFPSEEDLPSESIGIDEQEQEELIDQLREQDTSTTIFYRALFLALPALAALPFLYTLVTNPSVQTLLALSSLGATGWVLYGVPVGATEREQQMDRGPLARWLAPLNGLLAGALAIGGLVAARKNESDGEGIFAVLPLGKNIYLVNENAFTDSV